jgi:hypothetical protein
MRKNTNAGYLRVRNEKCARECAAAVDNGDLLAIGHAADHALDA